MVGASLAGLQAAQTLRRDGFDGELTMVGDEPHYPYDRPPLSKHFLAGAWEEEKLRLRAAADPDALGLTWRLGTAATGLDLEAKRLELSEGPALGYDGLIIATGAAARTLPGCELAGVHVLRTLDDAVALRADFDGGPDHVVVIGAGFIGAEVAATARERGLAVTMIEAASVPLGRVLDRSSGEAIADLHRANGVDVRLGVGVSGMRSAGGRVTHVDLEDGSAIQTSVVVVGIGVVPNVGWLEGSGLTLDDGILCDETCLAAPSVVAAGDVARWPNARFGGAPSRVEQWDNAIEQGAYAARRLLAWLSTDPDLATDLAPFQPVPWFWSDQYDKKIQLAGIPTETAAVVHGSVQEQRFVKIYLDDAGLFVGALAWNRPRQAIQARQLLAEGASAEDARAKLAPAPA